MNNPYSVFIIAEAGVNHNGSIDLAKELIDQAVICGADAIKFQSFKAENMVVKNAPKAEYQKTSVSDNISQFDLISALELKKEDLIFLNNYCKDKIEFICSVFDEASALLLHELDINIIKIPSGEITNFPLLQYLGSLNTKLILSTGMSTMQEIKDALDVLTISGAQKSNISILHCTSEYPAPFDEVNLSAIKSIKNEFDLNVGYSDHTCGTEIPIAAVALGAKIIEKHFTLDREMIGPDHKASADPNELKTMVNAIRNVEQAIGNGIKRPTKSEINNIVVVRKSIVAAKNIKKDDLFSEKNLTTKRPAGGISPMMWSKLIGKKATKSYVMDEFIEF